MPQVKVHYLIEDKIHIRCVLAEEQKTRSFLLIFMAEDNALDTSILGARISPREALKYFEEGMQEILPRTFKYQYIRTDIDKMMDLSEVLDLIEGRTSGTI